MSDIRQSRDISRDPPVIDLDPYAEEHILDPYPYHDLLRAAGPVVWLSKYNVYAVGRFDQVKAVASDYAHFSSSAGIGLVDKRDPATEKFRTTSPMTEEDPPLHTSTRSGVQKLMSPVIVRSWRERFERVADQICDDVLRKSGPVDVVKDIAERFVVEVFPESLGLDVPKEYLTQIGEMNLFSLGPQNGMQAKAYEKVKHVIEWYDQAAKRENVKPGTLGDIIYQAEDAGIFRPGVGIGLVRTFLRGGSDNTIAGIAATIYHLARNPAQWQLVKSDHSKARNAFEEAIRIETPPQILYRLVTHDMEFCGYNLRGNTKIAFHPGSANRDPSAWTDPQSYDINREIMGKHIAFGVGPHICIGQMIARLEAETIIQALLRRVDELQFAGEPEWRAVSAFRGLKQMPMKLLPAAN